MLQLENLLPEGATLPSPNPDPSYVPTPPKAKLAKVSPKGVTRIEFSEAVFEYEDLKNFKVPQLLQSGERMLQDKDIVELVPFVEVYVEPGDTADP